MAKKEAYWERYGKTDKINIENCSSDEVQNPVRLKKYRLRIEIGSYEDELKPKLSDSVFDWLVRRCSNRSLNRDSEKRIVCRLQTEKGSPEIC